MKKTALLYYPKGGNVERAAKRIQEKIGQANIDVYEISTVKLEDLKAYELYIVGGSTVGAPNWESAYTGDPWGPFNKQVLDTTPDLFKDKKIALFGLGDQILYPDDFVNHIKILYDRFKKLGAINIGEWIDDKYDFTDSDAFVDDKFLGLALDEDNQDDLTDERIDKWLEQILK